MSVPRKFVTTSTGVNEPAALMFCTSLDEAVVERSSVLQALQEAGQSNAVSGLPEGVQQHEVLLRAANDPEVCDLRTLQRSDLTAILRVRSGRLLVLICHVEHCSNFSTCVI